MIFGGVSYYHYQKKIKDEQINHSLFIMEHISYDTLSEHTISIGGTTSGMDSIDVVYEGFKDTFIQRNPNGMNIQNDKIASTVQSKVKNKVRDKTIGLIGDKALSKAIPYASDIIKIYKDTEKELDQFEEDTQNLNVLKDASYANKFALDTSFIQGNYSYFIVSPGYKTGQTIERLNQYIITENAGLGKYDASRPITVDDVFTDYDTINEIIQNMTNAQRSVVFVY